jgi:hypothetical protein
MKTRKCPICKGTGRIPIDPHNFLRAQYLIFMEAGERKGRTEMKREAIAAVKMDDKYLDAKFIEFVDLAKFIMELDVEDYPEARKKIDGFVKQIAKDQQEQDIKAIDDEFARHRAKNEGLLHQRYPR